MLKNNSGLTLLELLLSIVIFSVIMTIIALILFQSFTFLDDSSQRIAKNRLDEVMLENISRFLRKTVKYEEKIEAGENTKYIYYIYQNLNEDGQPIDLVKLTYDKAAQTLELLESDKLVQKLDNVASFNLTTLITDQKSDFRIELSTITNGIRKDKIKTVYSRNLAVLAEEE